MNLIRGGVINRRFEVDIYHRPDGVLTATFSNVRPPYRLVSGGDVFIRDARWARQEMPRRSIVWTCHYRKQERVQ